MATKTVHGYYRFTDIFFEWSKVMPSLECVRSLKAFIAYDCLVNPMHPLSNGKGGIELWNGTLPNGESRLMFTSHQIEYIRYWLNAMNLTPEPVPLPSSDYLIDDKELVHTSPVIYRDGPTLKKAIKTIDKNNKKLKGVSSLLSGGRVAFEKARVCWGAKKGAWLAIDFEAWDRDHKVLKEFGYSFVQWRDGEQFEEQGHLVRNDHRRYYNTYVPNFCDNYQFGTSLDVNRADFKQKINELIIELSTDQPLYLIFHDYRQDLKYLNSPDIEAPLNNIAPVLPESARDSGIYIVDTSNLFGALEGEGVSNNKRSLKFVCKSLGVETEYLHNAGNDAHYTLLAAVEMMSGDPVDMQREKRWPGRTDTTGPGGKGVRVRFNANEEDSDMSDTEGVLGGGTYHPKTGVLREIPPAVEDQKQS